MKNSVSYWDDLVLGFALGFTVASLSIFVFSYIVWRITSG